MMRRTFIPAFLLTASFRTPLTVNSLYPSSFFISSKVHNVKTQIKMSSTEIDTQNDKNLILVVGSANQDLTSTSDVLPTLGETIMGKDFAIGCGGKGFNQALACHRLGMAPVAMVARVGDDLFGRNLLDNFRRVGVNYFGEAETVLNATASGVASIVVDEKSGDNQIIVTPGANYKLTQEDVRQKIMDTKPKQVLVQLEILPRVAFEALKAGKDVGATTIFNTAPAPEGWSLEEPAMQFYKYVDILILNETELKKVTSNGEEESSDEETLAKSLITKGIGNAVIVTLGDRGAMIVEKNDQGGIETVLVDAPEDLPARKLPVKNTVGAGDSFCGALAAYRSTGLSLADAARYACGVASMTVRKDGAQTSYPLYDELPDCLKLIDRPTKRSKTSLKPIITFVTGNKKKLEEVKQILSSSDGKGSAPFELTNVKIDLPELQGYEICCSSSRIGANYILIFQNVFNFDCSSFPFLYLLNTYLAHIFGFILLLLELAVLYFGIIQETQLKLR
jgi:ribokinase